MREQELKYLISAEDYDELRKESVEERLQTNYYFDTRAFPGAMLRLRQKHTGVWKLALKLRKGEADGVFVNEEKSVVVSAEDAARWQNEGISSEVVNRTFGVRFGPYLFRLLGSLQTLRCIVPVGEWRFEADRNDYCGKRDYEIECEGEDEASLQEAAKYLKERFSCRESTAKYLRFLREYEKGLAEGLSCR